MPNSRPAGDAKLYASRPKDLVAGGGYPKPQPFKRLRGDGVVGYYNPAKLSKGHQKGNIAPFDHDRRMACWSRREIGVFEQLLVADRPYNCH